MSLQHPLQQILNPITQISLNQNPRINYQTSFKPILSSHPHLILIPQITHSTLPKYLIQASLTPHLLFSTIHPNDSNPPLLPLLQIHISLQHFSHAINLISNQTLI
ncbi:ATPase, T2SS/T4P/T4SS family, partial [Staphylococcus epidermidis]|uniref:ATPase, T2SS/T4P/T4SS family n=1 Tax=Staphylococcus epidermidis TaxID=1282 RepID=UPI0037DA287B